MNTYTTTNKAQNTGSRGRLLPALALLAGSALATPAVAATDVYLVAKPFTQVMPDGVAVPMWGYALDADQDLATDGGEQASSPGPRLAVPDTESVLRIHLRNDLSTATSLVIPGQDTILEPEFFIDTLGRERVLSFTKTVAPGQTEIYEWTGLDAGSYRYLSGTHQAVQIQMGLQGALTHDSQPGRAYSKSHSSYETEVLLFYTEVDPVLHAAVDDGSYGTPAYSSTLDYRPQYFLVNGSPFTAATPSLPAGGTGEFTLLRVFNGGLQTHIPTLLGTTTGVIAEDGSLLAAPRITHALFMSAGKVLDALIRPSLAATYPLFDRAMALTDSDVSGGGMLSYLEVTAPLQQLKTQAAVANLGQRVFDAELAVQTAQSMPETTAQQRAQKKKQVKSMNKALNSAKKRQRKLDKKLAKTVSKLGTLEEVFAP